MEKINSNSTDEKQPPTSAKQNGYSTVNSSLTARRKILAVLRDNALLFVTLCGVIVGFGLGFGLRQYDLSDSGMMWLGKASLILSISFVCYTC